MTIVHGLVGVGPGWPAMRTKSNANIAVRAPEKVVIDSMVVEPAYADLRISSNGRFTIDLEPGAWYFRIQYGSYKVIRLLEIPDATDANYEDLVELDPGTLPPLPPLIDAVDALVAAVIEDEDSQTFYALTTELAATFAGQIPMGILLPAQQTFAAVQAAATDAAASGKRVWAAGTITTNQTLIIKSDADLSGLTINYTGSGVAVQLGDTTAVVRRLKVALPTVIAANKTVLGWAQVAGTVGVFAVNINACSEISVPRITNFETGLLVYGQGQGNVYNTFLIGHLDNNKINLKLDANATGWSNQNIYIGGRYSYESPEGANVAGAFPVKMVAGLANAINGNMWINPSFEGDTPQFHADFAGTANMMIGARWEAATPKVRWQDGSTRNQILWGYASQSIVETWGTGANANIIFSSNGVRLSASTSKAVMQLENSASAANPSLAVMEPGAAVAGLDPLTAYGMFLSSQQLRGKRGSEANARILLDFVNSRLYLGNGVLAPTMYLASFGTTGIQINGANLVFTTDNANDIGAVGANRPRDVRAGRVLQSGSAATASRPTAAAAGVGGRFYDTTLSKPIWSDGTVWRDAAGTAV